MRTMKFTLHRDNLFHAPIILDTSNFCYVQCISADLKMGAGIAAQFNKYYDVKNRMYANMTRVPVRHDCIRVDCVYNLVTKDYYWGKPRIEDMGAALMSLRKSCIEDGTSILAMPKIGCGLDRLRWMDVKHQIELTFDDLDIDVHVFDLPKRRTTI